MVNLTTGNDGMMMIFIRDLRKSNRSGICGFRDCTHLLPTPTLFQVCGLYLQPILFDIHVVTPNQLFVTGSYRDPKMVLSGT